jgi:hypothetical protein
MNVAASAAGGNPTGICAGTGFVKPDGQRRRRLVATQRK